MCPAAGLPPAGGQDAGRARPGWWPAPRRLVDGSRYLRYIHPSGRRTPPGGKGGPQGPADDQQDTLQGEREPVQFRLAAVEGNAPDTAAS